MMVVNARNKDINNNSNNGIITNENEHHLRGLNRFLNGVECLVSSRMRRRCLKVPIAQSISISRKIIFQILGP